MATLTQASCGVANSSKITISMWVRIADPSLVWATAPDTPIPLLEFGDFNATSSYTGSGVYYQPRPSYGPLALFAGSEAAYPELFIQLKGVSESRNLAGNLTGLWDNNPFSQFTSAGFLGDDIPANHWEAASFNPFMGGDYFAPCYTDSANGGAGGSAEGMIDVGKWFHVLYSIDCNVASVCADDNVTLISGPGSALLINGVQQWAAAADHAFAVLAPNTTGAGAYFAGLGLSYPNYAAGTGYERAGQTLAFSPGVYGAANDYFYTVGPDTFSEHFSIVKLAVPAFEISLAGKTIALPGFRNPNYKVDYADIQIWVDQQIDIRAHVAKFISAGLPVNKSVAAAEFGTPDFVFSGNSSGFRVNQGSGGSFTEVGTISDVAGP